MTETRSNLGFTLIEVVIAISILAFISLISAQAIQSAVRDKAKMQGSIGRTSEVRDALNIISRDINLAFNFRDLNIDLYNEAQQERIERKKNKDSKKKDPPPGDPPTAPTETTSTDQSFKKREQKILTHFIGENNALHFTTRSNIRQLRNIQSSDQAEIGYFIRDCRSRKNIDQRSKCLWRRLSVEIDDDVKLGGDEVVLLENVQEFKLKYLGPGSEEEWLDSWKTDETGAPEHRNKFPFAVEITLSTKNSNIENDKTIIMTSVAPLRFPNNFVSKEKKKNPDGTPADEVDDVNESEPE